MVSYLISLALVAGQGGFVLRDGDRVLFYGDSITDNQFYPQYVENYVLTRFPNLKVTFMNYGWSGDRVTGGGGGDIAKRLARDVVPHKPSVVTIMLGMNDGLYRPWDENIFQTYATGYEKILTELKARVNPRFTLIKPSAYDDVTMAPAVNGSYNSVLQKYGDFLAGISFKYAATVADFNAPVVDLLTRAKSIDAEGARRLVFDRVHPSPAAHIVMGDALIKAWNGPSLVSAVAIDGSTGYAKSDNAQVKEIKRNPSGVTWKALDAALPMYLDRNAPQVGLVLKASEVWARVNQQPLKVTNLPIGSYKLSIDGEDMGTFPTENLSAGINLADLNTPMMKQSAQVAMWSQRRQYLRQTMWRSIVVATEDMALTHRDQAIKSLERLEADVVEKQRQTAKPVWHEFKLERVQ